MHRKADGVGHPQHGIGRRDVTAFQRGADAGGGNRLLLKLCHRQDDDLHAQRRAELTQQLRCACRPGTEGEVLAAEQRPGVAVPDDAQHELLGRHGLDLLKIGAEVVLDAEAGDEGVLVLGGEQPLTLHLVLGGQAEGEDHRGRAMGFGPLHRAANDSPVADVDAVKKAHCHSRAVGTAQRKRRKL